MINHDHRHCAVGNRFYYFPDAELPRIQRGNKCLAFTEIMRENMVLVAVICCA